MRYKYVNLIKDFITKKPQYKETLDEIKKDTLIIGGTEEEFEEAIKEVEAQEDEEKKDRWGKFFFGRKTIIRVTLIIGFVILLLPVFTIGYSKFSEKEALTPIVSEIKQAENSTENEIVRVVYANSTPIDMTQVFSVNPDRVVLSVTGKPNKEILGFFPYWMMENWDKVNLGSLTSIALFGLEVDGNGDVITRREDGVIDPGWEMWQNPNLERLINKARGNNQKVYLTVKSFNNNNIKAISNSDEAQQGFVANVSYLVSSRNLDGVNIDFEATNEIDQETRDGFSRLIKNLNIELKKQNPNAAITIDTYLVSGSEQGLFDLAELTQDADAFVIMGYDMHTLKGDSGSLAAMGGETNIIGYVQNYLEKIPSNKIILAVPYYGYDWPQIRDAAESKALPYAIIAENIDSSNLSWNENSQTPSYTYVENGIQRVVHFDNIRSLGIKYDYIKDKNLKGVGIWALGYDGNNTDLQKLLNDKFYIPN